MASIIAPQTQKRNFRLVQLDALGVGVANVAGNFLSVFLARLGASNTQLGLLQSMPGMTGLLLSVAAGRFLQSRGKVTLWFAFSRLAFISGYALTGLAPFLVPREYAVPVILAIWAVITLPQTLLGVAFTVVMSGVAGPERRYELMSLRWSTLQITTAVGVALVGQVLNQPPFPQVYQWTFIALSLGGLFSFWMSSQIQLAEQQPGAAETQAGPRRGLLHILRDSIQLLRQQPAFGSFVLKRVVFTTGMALGGPLFSPYLVHVVKAPDSWIGFISTAQLAVMLVGYFVWTRQSRKRSPRFVLLWTTLGVSLYPALVALTRQVEGIALFAGLAGFFQAGLDLVFFDELMKTVPPERSATYVALAQTIQYLPSILAPMIGTALADGLGLPAALLISAGVRLVGFLLFTR